MVNTTGTVWVLMEVLILPVWLRLPHLRQSQLSLVLVAMRVRLLHLPLLVLILKGTPFATELIGIIMDRLISGVQVQDTLIQEPAKARHTPGQLLVPTPCE